jgi:signal peptide peptidase SppA
MNFNLAYLKYQILAGAWFIDDKAVHGYGSQINDFLKAEILDGEKEPVQCLVFVITPEKNILRAEQSTSFNTIFDFTPEGSIAIIPINGSLMKYDYCGAPGMQTLGQRINTAAQHKNISSIVLKIDSPGGTVDGTQELANIIKASKKPIVALADGLMASAAYWIGSAADKIIANAETTQVGSIGAMISFADVRPVYEKQGVVFHDINADQSKDKNSIYLEALKGNYKPIKEELINVAAQEFIDNVKANRGDKIKETETKPVFTGKVYFAKDALELGLIDEIGNIETAINAANDMVIKNNINLKNTEMKINIKEAWKSLMSLLKIEKEGEVELTEQNMIDLNAKLADSEAKIESLNAENIELKKQLEAQDKVLELIQKEYEDFKAADAKIETKSTKEKDNINSNNGDDFSGMAHNKEADKVTG